MKISRYPLALLALNLILIHAASAQEGRIVRASDQPAIAALSTPPSAVEDLYATMWRNASTPVREWVTEQAVNARSGSATVATLQEALRASIENRFAGQGLDQASSSMLVFL